MDDVSLLIRRNKRGNDPKLILSYRFMTIIPMCNLTHLEILDLSNNKISSLDANLQNLKALKMLDVSNNSISKLEVFLSKMNLQIFSCANNPLIPPFIKLLQTENQQQPKLAEVLEECFSNQPGSKPTWFENPMNQTYSHNHKKETIQNLLKEEQQKVIQLKTQLEQMNTKDLPPSNTHSHSCSDLEIDFQELLTHKTISQGGFSLVYKGSFRSTEVAIKKIFDPNVTQELLDEFQNEIQMLSKLRHPNIVLIMGVVSKPPNLSIVTEYLPNGSLFKLLHEQQKEITQNQKIQLALSIAKSIHFLHKSHIVHRDIKSHNILLDDNHKTKLCDFGLAKDYHDLNKGTRQFCGTPCYMAPELFQKKKYSHKIDIFAFGTLLWEIFAREVPFEGQDPQDIMKKVVSNYQLPKIDHVLTGLVNACRQLDPEQRPDLDIVIDQLTSLI